MILDPKKVRRAGVYLFFDKQGTADEYIIQMIEDLKRSTEYMLVVCNGYVTADSLRKLKSVSDEVICRANTGFDLGAYRDGILYLGYKKLSEYDEIIFVNYTFFGPAGSFNRVFAAMEPLDLDFWGITKHHKVDPDPFGIIGYGFLPEHIQSHFIAVRRNLFMSYEYRDFVMNRANPESYVEAICSYEAIFTKYFADLGYKWSVYSDTSEYERISFYPLMFRPAEMMERQDCPILKRRGFFTNYDDFLYNTGGEPTKIVYERLKKTGEYDLNLLWDNLLRLENMTCIHRNMHLDYMCDPEAEGEKPENAVLSIAAFPLCDTLFFGNAFLQLEKAFKQILVFGTEEEYENIRNLSGYRERIIHAGPYRSYSLFLKETAGRVSEEDFVLLLDLAEEAGDRHERVIGNSEAMSHLAENDNVVREAIRHFRENGRMGLLVPPAFTAAGAIRKTKDRWLGRFFEVKERMKKVQPALNFSEDENPVWPCAGSFWIRGNVLRETADDYEADDERDILLLILPLLVQHHGAYTGRCYNIRKYPKVLEEQVSILRECNKVLFRLYGAGLHLTVREQIVRDGNGQKV